MHITLENIDFSYIQNQQKEIFRNFNLQIKSNEFICIVGESGCGKTTLLHLISGVLKPNNGKVQIEQCTSISHMFQDNNLLPWYTLRRNLEVSAKIAGKKNISSLIDKMIDLYGLTDASQLYPYQLSGGMQQRAVFIRTMLLDAEVLLLDEPFSQLNYAIKIKIIDILYEWVKKNNKIAIMITHQIEDAIICADRIIYLGGSPCHIQKDIPLTFPNSLLPSERMVTEEYVEYESTLIKGKGRPV